MASESPEPIDLLGLTPDELEKLLDSRARALAALRWLHGGERAPERVPASIPGVSAKAWAPLAALGRIALPRVEARSPSADGTIKYALEVPGGEIEAVLIPARGRSTVCVSSQVGCTRACAFCATARLGFSRNLTAAEIVGQFQVARADAPQGAPLRNVVFMGMGEPMDNLAEVQRAIRVLTAQPAPQLAADHVTVSTSGILPAMRRYLAESPAHLALSLNATTDEVRERLMPQTRLWPISELMAELRADASRKPARLHFVEYVLFDGVNDSDADARRLLALLEGVRARVNLIAHNPVDGCGLRASPPERVRAFQAIVHAGGVRCLVRASRGQEVAAACGQLARRRSAGCAP